mgnify:CR=1 FL=1
MEELTEVEERFQEQLLSLETGVEQDEGRLDEAEDGSEAIEEVSTRIRRGIAYNRVHIFQ